VTGTKVNHVIRFKSEEIPWPWGQGAHFSWGRADKERHCT